MLFSPTDRGSGGFQLWAQGGGGPPPAPVGSKMAPPWARVRLGLGLECELGLAIGLGLGLELEIGLEVELGLQFNALRWARGKFSDCTSLSTRSCVARPSPSVSET